MRVRGSRVSDGTGAANRSPRSSGDVRSDSSPKLTSMKEPGSEAVMKGGRYKARKISSRRLREVSRGCECRLDTISSPRGGLQKCRCQVRCSQVDRNDAKPDRDGSVR